MSGTLSASPVIPTARTASSRGTQAQSEALDGLGGDRSDEVEVLLAGTPTGTLRSETTGHTGTQSEPSQNLPRSVSTLCPAGAPDLD